MFCEAKPCGQWKALCLCYALMSLGLRTPAPGFFSCVIGIWCLNFSEPTCLVRTRLSENLMCAVHTGVTKAGVKDACPFKVLCRFVLRQGVAT